MEDRVLLYKVWRYQSHGKWSEFINIFTAIGKGQWILNSQTTATQGLHLLLQAAFFFTQYSQQTYTRSLGLAVNLKHSHFQGRLICKLGCKSSSNIWLFLLKVSKLCDSWRTWFQLEDRTISRFWVQLSSVYPNIIGEFLYMLFLLVLSVKWNMHYQIQNNSKY